MHFADKAGEDQVDYTYKVLESDYDLLAAALSGIPVAVAVKEYEDDILEDGAEIREYTPNSVRINGLSYSRELYEFRAYPGPGGG
ncbi:hypothetical protein D3C75_1156460 [compost metagenome]